MQMDWSYTLPAKTFRPNQANINQASTINHPVASAAVLSMAVVLLLLIHCLLLLTLFCVFCVWSLFFVCVTRFAVILLGKREFVALIVLPLYASHVFFKILCLFLVVLWVGLPCVFVDFLAILTYP